MFKGIDSVSIRRFSGDINDPYSYISRLLKVKDTVRIRPELGTEPSLRYIPVVKKGV